MKSPANRLFYEWHVPQLAHVRAAPDLNRAIRDRWERGTPFADVSVLMDAYAPTDALLTNS